MPNPSPAPLADLTALLQEAREIAEHIRSGPMGRAPTMERAAQLLNMLALAIEARVLAAPRAPSAAAIEGLAAEWYEESYGQGWNDATHAEQKEFRVRAQTQLVAAYAVDGLRAPPSGPSQSEWLSVED